MYHQHMTSTKWYGYRNGTVVVTCENRWAAESVLERRQVDSIAPQDQPMTMDDDYGYDEPPTCSICDGVHGYYCPLESPDPMYYADEMREGR